MQKMWDWNDNNCTFTHQTCFDNLLCANQDDRFVSSTIRQRVMQPADTGTSSLRVLEVHASEYLSPCIFIELFTSPKIKKRDYRCGRRECYQEVREWAKTQGQTTRSQFVMFSKKEEMGFFLSLHTPFNYVSLLTTSLSKCLPRCSFSLQDTEVTAEMWFCRVTLGRWPWVWKLPGIDLMSGMVGKSRRQEDLINHRSQPL